MGRRSRFITPQIKRLPLSDDDWIEVKLDLNTGDSKILERAGVQPPIMLNGRPFEPMDWTIYEMTKVHIYLLDWSFRDSDDKPVKVSLDALKNLDPMDFAEISKTVSKHIQERLMEKKALRDSTNSPNPKNNGSDQTLSS